MAFPITLALFRSTFPEFASAPDAQVSQQIAWAQFQIDPNVFGLQAEQAHGLLVAHALSLAPGGQQSRLDPKTLRALDASSALETTTYGMTFVQMRQIATVALRVF
jgi:Protein of unknown function (DUF4054)